GNIKITAEQELGMERHARMKLQAILEQRQKALETYRNAVWKQYVSGHHELEAYVIGRTLRTRAREIAGANHVNLDAESSGHSQDTEFCGEDTKVFKRSGWDDEKTSVFRRAGADATSAGGSDSQAGSMDPPAPPGSNPGQTRTPEELERVE